MVLSDLSFLVKLIVAQLADSIVGIQGFQTFSRGSSYWAAPADYWGWYFAPWSVIGAFDLVVLLFSLRYGNPFRFGGLGEECMEDMAPDLPPKEIIVSVRKRAWISFLDSL